MSSRAMWARRSVAVVLGSTLASVLLGACGGHQGEEDLRDPVEAAVHETASGFLNALVDGRYDAAVELSDVSAEDFACSWLLADRRDRPMLAASVDAVTVDDSGARARADVVYNESEQGSLDLVGSETTWRVEFPENYRLEASFTSPAVVEMQLQESPTADLYSPRGDEEVADCAIAALDGVMSTPAFPDRYMVTFADPTGVIDYSYTQTWVSVGRQETAAPSLGDPISDAQLEVLQNEMLFAHLDGRVQCAGSPCEDGTFDPTVELSLTKVWTDDEEQWSVEVEQGDQVFTGTLARTANDLIFDVAAVA